MELKLSIGWSSSIFGWSSRRALLCARLDQRSLSGFKLYSSIGEYEWGWVRNQIRSSSHQLFCSVTVNLELFSESEPGCDVRRKRASISLVLNHVKSQFVSLFGTYFLYLLFILSSSFLSFLSHFSTSLTLCLFCSCCYCCFHNSSPCSPPCSCSLSYGLSISLRCMI